MLRYLHIPAAILLLMFASIACALPQGSVIGRVTLTLGTIDGVDQDGDTFAVVRGTELHAGYTMDTRARSLVRMEMLDGTQMTLTQNSTITLNSFSFDEAQRLGSFDSTVTRGGFKYQSGRLGQFSMNRQHSRISTPNGVIGVRGTIIEAVLEGGRLTIRVPQGNIDITFTRPDGTTFVQRIGVDEPVTIVQLSDGGELTNLDDLPPALQTVIQVLEQQVREAEAASSDSTTTTPTEAEQQEQLEQIQLNLDNNTLSTQEGNTAGGGAGRVIEIPASPSTTNP